jgi:predicted nuclease of predicted toxin-antitoxin system
MRLKLDENIDTRLVVFLRASGHDVVTVRQQDLHGTNDVDLYRICSSEDRALVTLDLDFSNVLRYPPENTPGLIVLRGPDDLFPTVRILVETLANALISASPSQHLWIVEIGRVRIHERQ